MWHINNKNWEFLNFEEIVSNQMNVQGDFVKFSLLKMWHDNNENWEFLNFEEIVSNGMKVQRDFVKFFQ
jgi:hypothetical protein